LSKVTKSLDTTPTAMESTGPKKAEILTK
jgi:hypothetical protein